MREQRVRPHDPLEGIGVCFSQRIPLPVALSAGNVLYVRRGGAHGSRAAAGAAYRRTLFAAAAGFAVTVVVALGPNVRIAFDSPEARLVLETTAGLVTGLVAVLFFGRFRQSRSLQALLLVYAMGLLCVAALVFVVVPLLGGLPSDGSVTTWSAVVVRQMGGLLLLAAAVLPGRVLRRRHRLWEALGFVAVLLGVVGLVQAMTAGVPAVVTSRPPAQDPVVVPTLEAHPAVLAVQVANLVCFAVASVAFTRQSARTGDDLPGWVGAAAAVGAWARVNYLLYPSLFSTWFYAGDLLRLGFYCLLLVGVWREINRYWAAQAETAAFGERRRLARDLHDGTLQEIGYIRSRLSSADGPEAERIRAAADRAIDETRAALAALTAPPDEAFAVTLRRSLEATAGRYDVRVDWSQEAEADAFPRHREDLLRIAREALTNAARHGHAQHVSVRLCAGELEVTDDGKGFDTAEPARPGSFGLTSMRDRATGMGGALHVESEPGRGTTVRVTWPTS